MATIEVHVPKIEDEIEEAWGNWSKTDAVASHPGFRAVFEAGFRAARTFLALSA